jgi:hypothetical protein
LYIVYSSRKIKNAALLGQMQESIDKLLFEFKASL